jgi:acyl-CoA synthetase (AMP-forming)/AMP-acid ligase II
MLADAGSEDLWSLLCERSRLHPNRTAFRILDGKLNVQAEITFGQLKAAAAGRAGRLSKLGYEGATIALTQPTGLDFLISFYAVLAAGGAVAPLNSRLLLRPDLGLRPILDSGGVSAVMADAATAERLARRTEPLGPSLLVFGDTEAPSEQEPSAPDPDGLAVVQFTSGSTSQPKGARISHANFLANAETITDAFGSYDDDVVVSWLPLHHDMGLMLGVVWPLFTGAVSVLMRPGVFVADPLSWLKAISRYRGRVSSGPNFAYQACIDAFAAQGGEGMDLAAWRLAICGAEPVLAQTTRRFIDAFTPAGFAADSFFPSFGLAEATLFVSGARAPGQPNILRLDSAALQQGEIRPPIGEGSTRDVVSCGRCGLGVEVRIVDPATCMPLSGPEAQASPGAMRAPPTPPKQPSVRNCGRLRRRADTCGPAILASWPMANFISPAG